MFFSSLTSNSYEILFSFAKRMDFCMTNFTKVYQSTKSFFRSAYVKKNVLFEKLFWWITNGKLSPFLSNLNKSFSTHTQDSFASKNLNFSIDFIKNRILGAIQVLFSSFFCSSLIFRSEGLSTVKVFSCDLINWLQFFKQFKNDCGAC